MSKLVEQLSTDIMRSSEIAGELRKSREASLVITKLDEARLWLEEYKRKQVDLDADSNNKMNAAQSL